MLFHTNDSFNDSFVLALPGSTEPFQGLDKPLKQRGSTDKVSYDSRNSDNASMISSSQFSLVGGDAVHGRNRGVGFKLPFRPSQSFQSQSIPAESPDIKITEFPYRVTESLFDTIPFTPLSHSGGTLFLRSPPSLIHACSFDIGSPSTNLPEDILMPLDF